MTEAAVATRDMRDTKVFDALEASFELGDVVEDLYDIVTAPNVETWQIAARLNRFEMFIGYGAGSTFETIENIERRIGKKLEDDEISWLEELWNYARSRVRY